jgi:hypothetical protein
MKSLRSADSIIQNTWGPCSRSRPARRRATIAANDNDRHLLPRSPGYRTFDNTAVDNHDGRRQCSLSSLGRFGYRYFEPAEMSINRTTISCYERYKKLRQVARRIHIEMVYKTVAQKMNPVPQRQLWIAILPRLYSAIWLYS